MSLLLLFSLGGGGSAVSTVLTKGFAGKKQKPHRKQVRDALLLAMAEEPAETKKLLAKFAPFAEVSVRTINLDDLVKDVVKVQQLLRIAQRIQDDDEDALMVLML